MFFKGDGYEIAAHVRRPIILQIFTDGRKLKLEQSDRPCIFQRHNLICHITARQIIEVCCNVQKEQHVHSGGKELGGEGVGRGLLGGGGRKTSIFNPFPGIKDLAHVLGFGWEWRKESERGEGGKRSQEQSWGCTKWKQLSPAPAWAIGAPKWRQHINKGRFSNSPARLVPARHSRAQYIAVKVFPLARPQTKSLQSKQMDTPRLNLPGEHIGPLTNQWLR